MRAAAEREDLAGLGRILPALVALLIPVLGPLVAVRIVGTNLRPVLVSVAGAVLGFGAFVMAPQAKPMPKGAQVIAGKGAGGTPTATVASAPKGTPTKPAEAKAPETKAVLAESAAKPAAPAKPAPAPKAEPALPAEKPSTPAPIPTAIPVVNPTPSRTATPIPLAGSPWMAEGAVTAFSAVVPGDQPAGTTAATANALLRPVRASGQLLVPGPYGQGSTMTAWLARSAVNNTRVVLAAVICPPPGTSAPPQLYLGGKVYYFNTLADTFDPLAVPPGDLTDGRSISLLSHTGALLAQLQIGDVTRGELGDVTAATLDVQLR